MLRDTQAAVRVQASQVVFTERHDLGVSEPIEWSDHSGVQASLLIELYAGPGHPAGRPSGAVAVGFAPCAPPAISTR